MLTYLSNPNLKIQYEFDETLLLQTVLMTYDFDTPLLKLGAEQSDWWSIRDAFEGVQIFGGIGSGKTSGSGQMIAKSFLRNGFGGLVLCAKPEEVETWRSYAAATGRTNDLRVFEEGSEFCFNPLAYENEREGKGGGEVFNLSNLFMQIYKMGAQFSGGGGGEKDRYWDNALKRSLNRMLQLLKYSNMEISVSNMIEVMSDAPDTDLASTIKYIERGAEYDELWETNIVFKCLEHIRHLILDYEEELETLRGVFSPSNEEVIRRDELAEYLPELKGVSKRLDSYWLKEFANVDEKTRSIVRESFLGLAEPFTMGILEKHFSSDTTIKPEESFEGKIIILNFSVKEYLDAGIYAQGIFKYIWQQAIERRNTKAFPTPCFLWVDESQYFVNEYDTIFQTTARSSQTATVFITQNISNYYSAMGSSSTAKAKVDSLLGNLSTKIFHSNNDTVTNEWASNSIGKYFRIIETESSSKKKFEIFDTTKGKSATPHLMPQVLAIEFSTLKSGGKNNQNQVQAVITVRGKEWSSGKNHKRATFTQPKKS